MRKAIFLFISTLNISFAGGVCYQSTPGRSSIICEGDDQLSCERSYGCKWRMESSNKENKKLGFECKVSKATSPGLRNLSVASLGSTSLLKKVAIDGKMREIEIRSWVGSASPQCEDLKQLIDQTGFASPPTQTTDCLGSVDNRAPSSKVDDDFNFLQDPTPRTIGQHK